MEKGVRVPEQDECARVRERIAALNAQLSEVRPVTDDLREQMRFLQTEIAEAELLLDELGCA